MITRLDEVLARLRGILAEEGRETMGLKGMNLARTWLSFIKVTYQSGIRA